MLLAHELRKEEIENELMGAKQIIKELQAREAKLIGMLKAIVGDLKFNNAREILEIEATIKELNIGVY